MLARPPRLMGVILQSGPTPTLLLSPPWPPSPPSAASTILAGTRQPRPRSSEKLLSLKVDSRPWLAGLKSGRSEFINKFLLNSPKNEVFAQTSIVDSKTGTGTVTPVNLFLHFPGKTGVGQHCPGHLSTQFWRFEPSKVPNINHLRSEMMRPSQILIHSSYLLSISSLFHHDC